MLPKGGGEPVSAGLNVVLLGGDGRIVVDYMFNEPLLRAW